MKTKIITSLILGIFALMLLTSAVSAATLAEWGLTSDASVNSSTLDSYITAASLTAGSGITAGTPTFTISGVNYTGWESTSINLNDYYQVSLTAKTGYNATINTISFLRSTTDASTNVSMSMTWSKNSAFSSSTNLTLYGTTANNTKASSSATGLSISLNEGETLYLRLYGYGADASTDAFLIENFKIEGSTSRLPTFCSDFAINDSDLTLNVDVSNRDGDDDDEWFPLNTIEVDVEFKNKKNNVDLDDVVFELGLFKKTDTSLSDNLAEDLIWLSEDENEIKIGNVDEDETVSHIFKFRVDPDFDADNYRLFVKAYPKGDEDLICIDHDSSVYYEEIKISEETDEEKMVIVDVDSLTQPIDALCGEEVTLTADIYNIGDDFDDDQIMVNLYSPELGLDVEQVSDVDAGDKTEVTFTFTVPKGAEEKTYNLYMRTYADYDEDDEEYSVTSDDEFMVKLKVEGACVFDPKLTVSADLTSGGKAGQEMVVKVMVTNTDSKTRTFTISSSGYDTWAKLVKFSPETLTLDAGESEEVEVTLLVNSDAEGKKTFSLDLTNENQKVIPQPVEVVVEKAGFSLFPGTGALIGNKNWYVWAIGALNIVLVLIIILVAVRLVKK